MLNPKVGVFYVTFLPQFVPAGTEVATFTVLLAAVHATEGVLWFGLLVAATRPLTGLLRRAAVVRALDRLTGSVLVAFGLRLAFEERR
jgi:threonine/homoserine/homoserine lactone efflux protein